MFMNNLVTVIITTHKRDPEILKRAIDSVYNQSYQLFEVIIVDDFPEFDKHLQILKLVRQYDSRLCYLINNQMKSACASRNIGIDAAKGEYIALLDDDDEWVSNKLEIMLPVLQESVEVGLVYGLFSIIDGFGRETIHKTRLCSGYIFDQLLLDGNFLGGCSVPIFKKKIIEKTGLFDTNLKSSQDYDFYLRIAKEYQIKFVDKVVVRYYISDDAISNSPERKVSSQMYILNKYNSDFERITQGKLRVEKNIIYSLLLAGKSGEARNYYNTIRTDVSILEFIKIRIRAYAKWMTIKIGIKKR